MIKNVIFKLIPMMNPDGVLLGNYRTGALGRDLNRQFNNASRFLYPTVAAFKILVKQLKKSHGEKLTVFLDFHGHSVKKNVFMYGPEYPIFDVGYFTCRILPKLISLKSEMFRFYSCIFRIAG